MTPGLRFVFGPDSDDQSWRDAVKRCSQEFVRSRTQLALYEPERRPTGHRLTAWEVWHAYGSDVVEEAVENGVAVLKETEDAPEAGLLGYWKELGVSSSAVAEVTGLSEEEVSACGVNLRELPIRSLESIAFALGLDERLLSFKADCGPAPGLADRLNELWRAPCRAPERVSETATSSLAEAVSVMRAQTRLEGWLSEDSEVPRFETTDDYGTEPWRARQEGYALADKVRTELKIGSGRIASMRDLVTDRLRMPVVWTNLSEGVSGATVSCLDHDGKEFRGVAVNSDGGNADVWVRRVTLARELGHVLFDPPERIDCVRVNRHLSGGLQEAPSDDLVEQRADAFALAFLAPLTGVRERVLKLPASQDDVGRVMKDFGMCESAARRRIASCFDWESSYVMTAPSWARPLRADRVAEELITEKTLPCSVRESRRGKFAEVVSDCYRNSLITDDTAALYFGCSAEEVAVGNAATGV